VTIAGTFTSTLEDRSVTVVNIGLLQ